MSNACGVDSKLLDCWSAIGHQNANCHLSCVLVQVPSMHYQHWPFL